jgi:Winged helix DNA-binding domain
VRRISVSQRRALLARRHCLTSSSAARTPVEVADRLVALHATDPATVYLAVRARTRSGSAKLVEQALYTDRTLVRMLGMRRTMFTVPLDLVAVVQAACTRKVAATERRRLVKHLQQAGVVDDVEPWLADVEASTLGAIAERGEATAAELAAIEPRLRTSLLMAPGKPYAAQQNITTRVLMLLAADGQLVRARPRGSWTSSQYRWALAATWLPEPIPDLPDDEAEAQLARRWLAAYGPAPRSDLQWWTGWTTGQVTRALAHARVAADVVQVDLDGLPAVMLAEAVEQTVPAPPWAALLPALDPTPMGWSGRHWFLGDHARALFDRSGNIGPTVWYAGRIVGGWAQRSSGEVVVRLLEDIGADGCAAVDIEADRLRAWLGDIRVTPRFRTPLERELSS